MPPTPLPLSPSLSPPPSHADAASASALIDRLGGTGALARRLGVSAAAVSNYRRGGLPWSKYRDFHWLAEEAGLELSERAFAPRRKQPAAPPVAPPAKAADSGLADSAEAQPLSRLRRRLCARLMAAQAGAQLTPNALQPAEPFLKLLGEHMRQTMWVTRDAEGREFCLLADYTIAAALAWMAQAGGAPRRYWYAGGRFRQDSADPFNREDTELGFEHINGGAPLKDELQLLTMMRDLLAHIGLRHYRLLLNDYHLLDALLGALKLPGFWRRQVTRALRRDALNPLLAQHRSPRRSRRKPPPTAETEFLFGFRTPEKIKTRMREQAADSLSDPVRQRRLADYGALNGDFAQTRAALQKLAEQCGDKTFTKAVRHFVRRGEALIKLGFAPEHILFRPRYGAEQHYYTGLAFAITPPANERILASGGRYDSLLSRLGAQKPVPALGGTLRLEALQRELA